MLITYNGIHTNVPNLKLSLALLFLKDQINISATFQQSSLLTGMKNLRERKDSQRKIEKNQGENEQKNRQHTLQVHFTPSFMPRHFVTHP